MAHPRPSALPMGLLLELVAVPLLPPNRHRGAAAAPPVLGRVSRGGCHGVGAQGCAWGCRGELQPWPLQGHLRGLPSPHFPAGLPVTSRNSHTVTGQVTAQGTRRGAAPPWAALRDSPHRGLPGAAAPAGPRVLVPALGTGSSRQRQKEVSWPGLCNPPAVGAPRPCRHPGGCPLSQEPPSGLEPPCPALPGGLRGQSGVWGLCLRPHP